MSKKRFLTRGHANYSRRSDLKALTKDLYLAAGLGCKGLFA